MKTKMGQIIEKKNELEFWSIFLPSYGWLVYAA